MAQSDERSIRVSTWMSRRDLAGRHIPRARREPALNHTALSAPIEATDLVAKPAGVLYFE